ncbi:MAG: glutamine--fructose-6-phosphate transaminase (isomerizing) [Clostridia bacterium]|nr:glutamine--fructose-6-phosphate transaminase (isomerizing) [Clostridia bacterium]
MCGIVGFVGEGCMERLYGGMRRLEYRGYDSAGVCYAKDGRLVVVRKKGRVEGLRTRLGGVQCRVAMGHTRWATHGAPDRKNAHPHRVGRVAVVHNGIIRNHAPLRRQLGELGARFTSDTDTEVVAHLLDRALDRVSADGVIAPFRQVLEGLRGSYAFAVMVEGYEGVFLAKKGSPLMIGKGQNVVGFASDVPALEGQVDGLYAMQDGELALVEKDSLRLFDPLGGEKEVVLTPVERGQGGRIAEADCYMARELMESPRAATLLDPNRYRAVSPLREGERVVLVGCGTAYHAACYGAWLLGERARAVTAGEYEPQVGERVMIAISQSGETADTLAAVRQAKERGLRVMGICNVATSSLVSIADERFMLDMGQEMAVAATKSYVGQLAVLYGLCGRLQGERGKECPSLAGAMGRVLRESAEIAPLAKRHYDVVCLLARGADYHLALEGALKLKEVAYCACEVCYAGEVKHGPLALVSRRTLVVLICTQRRHIERNKSTLAEVRARGARTLVICPWHELGAYGDWWVSLPLLEEALMPLVAVLPLQYLAYRMARARGVNPDRPRNLAKSVTVE